MPMPNQSQFNSYSVQKKTKSKLTSKENTATAIL